MNFRYLVVLTGLIITFLSCVRDEENVKSIPFDKIVGNFKGISKSCLSQNLNTDTLCNIGKINEFRVTIYNFSTISLTDQKGTYDTLKLTFLRTEKINNENTYFFESKILNSQYSLKYVEQLQSLIFEYRVTTDINITTEYFVGFR